MHELLIIPMTFAFQQINHIDFRLAMALTAATINVSALFIYCNFGKIATESYEKICDCVFNLKWYRLSIRQQKYFVLMIQNMHKPFYYHGFGITYLNLDTFSTVSMMARFINYVIPHDNHTNFCIVFFHPVRKSSIQLFHGIENFYSQVIN